jgi:CheY-like chemotaxis protein
MELIEGWVMVHKITLKSNMHDHLASSFLIMTVLIVKNDATGGRSFSQLLFLQSHRYALLASSGSAALRLVKHIRPDLLLLDYNRLDMDGLELYRQLQMTKDLVDIPAIIVGANLLQDVTWKVETYHLVLLRKTFSLGDLLRITTRVGLEASK